MEINEMLFNARHDLKNLDHSVYFSLKYSRTTNILEQILETLKSFGELYDNVLSILPLKDYLEFFRNLPLYIEHKHFLITHSYACAGKETDRDDILWDRNFSKKFLDGINIFGHTHHHHPTKYHDKHWCIDTGAYKTDILTAVDLKTMQFYQTRK